MTIREPDAIIRYPVSGHDDPDRQIALRIINFLAGMEAKRAVAIYSLALTMSLRGAPEGFQRAALHGIASACLQSWDNWRGLPEPPDCPACGGAGTIGRDLEDQVICGECGGTGAAQGAM
jgi:hypothetical protein